MTIDVVLLQDQRIPEGLSHAPTYRVTEKINHNEDIRYGYHGHIERKVCGVYTDSGYEITRKDRRFYVQPHNPRQIIDIRKEMRALLRDIKEDTIRQFSKVPDNCMLGPNSKAIPLFEI